MKAVSYFRYPDPVTKAERTVWMWYTAEKLMGIGNHSAQYLVPWEYPYIF